MILTAQQKEVMDEAKQLLEQYGMCYLALRPR